MPHSPVWPGNWSQLNDLLTRIDGVSVNVKNDQFAGGAVGDGVKDDTAAIQAAFTAAAAGTQPGEVILPGKFKITAPIDIPFHALGGIKIKGSGRYGSIIEQATANTPIFRAQTDLTHSVHISDLTLQYATQAGVGDTNSYGIQWTNAASVTGGFFNWVLERVNIDKSYIAMGIKSPVAGSLPVWGLRAVDCKITNTRQSAIVLTSDVAVGQPRILLQNLYVSNDGGGIVPGGDCIVLTACSDAVIDGWELSSWANRALNVSAANTPLSLRAIHVENHSFTGAAPFLFLVTNGGANFQGVSIAGASNAGSFAIMFRADSSGEIYADGVSSAVAVNSGTVRAMSAGDTTSQLWLRHWETLSGAISIPVAAGDANSLACLRQYDKNLYNGVSALTYSASIATDAFLGNTYTINVTNGTAFTIPNPTNLVAGQPITYDIKNSSGGAHGVITWGATFLNGGAGTVGTGAFAGIANGKRRTIQFYYDGTNLIELSRTTDI